MVETQYLYLSMYPTQPVQDPRFTQTVHSDPPISKLALKKYIFIALGVIVAILLWTWVNSPMIVTVVGTGSVSVPATNATVSFTLSATDNSIQSAVASVQARADSMRQYLSSKGVLEGDIAQTQVTAVPASLVTSGATGFQATISMAAKTTRVSDISNIVSDLYTNGALVVSQPVLSVENQEKLDRDAFDMAMKDARSQAGTIGNSNWKFIRKVVSVSLVTSPTTSNSTTRADTLTTANDSTAAINGVFKIAKAVSVSYKMW